MANKARKNPVTVPTVGGGKKRNKPKKAKKPKEVIVYKQQAQQAAAPATANHSFLGSIGEKAGGWLGDLAGSAFSAITGLGAYTIKKNSLTTGRPPVFSAKSGENGTIEVIHQEYIDDVYGSSDFEVQEFDINPGQSNGFPWLSRIAQNFEEYELLGMVFQFRSTSATALNSTNTALGVLMMATNYDVLEPNFASKRELEAYMFSTSTSPSVSCMHPVECDPRENAMSTMYVRTLGVPPGADQRMYDMGRFQIATQGMQASANIGEIWVSYHIRLMKPKLSTEAIGESAIHIEEYPYLSGEAPSSYLGTDPGTGGGLRPGSTSTPTVIGGNYFSIDKKGKYLVTMALRQGGAGPTYTDITTPLTFGFQSPTVLTSVPFFLDGVPTVSSLESSTTAPSTCTLVTCINCADDFDFNHPNKSVVVFTGASGYAFGTFDLAITQVPENLDVEPDSGTAMDLIRKLTARLNLLESKEKDDFDSISVTPSVGARPAISKVLSSSSSSLVPNIPITLSATSKNKK